MQVWQYYDGGWHNYANDASLIVEGVFKEFEAAGEGSGLDIRAIQSGHFSYMVCLFLYLFLLSVSFFCFSFSYSNFLLGELQGHGTNQHTNGNKEKDQEGVEW